MKDYKIYIQVLLYMSYPHKDCCPCYVIALFTPTIINGFGYSRLYSYVALIIVGIYSNKHSLRGPYIVGSYFMSLVGYILLFCSTRPGPSSRYVGVFLAALSIFPPLTVPFAWVGSNARGDLKRGVALAMVIGLGGMGGYPPRFRIESGMAPP
jgi:hypothetical protein